MTECLILRFHSFSSWCQIRDIWIKINIYSLQLSWTCICKKMHKNEENLIFYFLVQQKMYSEFRYTCWIFYIWMLTFTHWWHIYIVPPYIIFKPPHQAWGENWTIKDSIWKRMDSPWYPFNLMVIFLLIICYDTHTLWSCGY